MASTITIQDTGSTSTTGQGGQTIFAGTPTVASFVSAAVSGTGAVGIELSGTWTGTIAFEQSQDGGTTWTAVDMVIQGVDTVVQSATSNGVFKGVASGNSQIRARATAAVTGTVNVAFLGNVVTDLQHVVVVGNSVQPFNQDTAALITFAAAGAGTVTSPDQVNLNHRGVMVFVDLTTATSTSLVVTIQGKDAASGAYYTLLASAAITTTTPVLMTVYPGCVAAANTVANLPLPAKWRISATITGGSAAATGTIGASLIV